MKRCNLARAIRSMFLEISKDQVAFCCVLIALFLSPQNTLAQPGYIHLQGDQFIDEHGDPFFPMVMNYYVDYYYQGTEGVFPTTPTPQDIATLRFGRSSLWSCTGYYNYPFNEGVQRLLQDFEELKAQGFNTVRFLSNALKKPDDPDFNPGFSLKAKYHNTGQGGVGMNMDPPYVPDLNTNPVVWFHFNTILAVCSLANTLGLKVIVEPVLGDEMLGNVGDDYNLDHVAFLEAFATFMASNNVHNLLAYEFFGEPTYADLSVFGIDHTKTEICELANTWTEAIRTHDPDHLLTIGAMYHDDMFHAGWDPMLLNVDFASVHVYPLVDHWEYDQDPSSFLANATDRYINMFRYYDTYLRKPYIVAETGFSAEDPFEACSITPNPLIGYPQTCLGDEADQKDFLEATLPGIRDSRCAGYGWWIYMNMHWQYEPTPSNVGGLPIGKWMERYFGLLRFGDPVDAPGTTGWEGSRKQAAQTLANWVISPPPPAPFPPIPAALDMNDRYFNQHFHPTNSITYNNPTATPPANQYGTVNGRVVDKTTGNPIAGAVINAHNNTHRIFIVSTGSYASDYRAYSTFSDNAGWFSVRALDDHPGFVNNANGTLNDPSGDGDWTIRDIKIAGYATEQVHVRDYFQQDFVYEVNTLQPQVDRWLVNEHVATGTTEDFSALASITVADLLIEGTSTMKARYEIHLLDGFDAKQGSETHIYTEPIFFECADVLAAELKSIDNGSKGLAQIEFSPKLSRSTIKLQFALPEPKMQLTVRPNPTSDRITCTFSGMITEGTIFH